MSFKEKLEDKLAQFSNFIYDTTMTDEKPQGCMFCYILRMWLFGWFLFNTPLIILGVFYGLLRQ
jgi:hypothetical protein